MEREKKKKEEEEEKGKQKESFCCRANEDSLFLLVSLSFSLSFTKKNERVGTKSQETNSKVL